MNDNFEHRDFTLKVIQYINKIIQHTLVECVKNGFNPILQIHDELCFSINEESDIIKVKELMENAIEGLKVPSKVDTAIGRSWGEAKE